MATRMRGSAKIRPPKRIVSEIQFDDAWRILAQAYQQIHCKNASSLSFEELYRNAYTLVLTKNGERLYKSIQCVVRDHLEETTRTSVWPLCVNLVDSSIFRGSLEQKEGGVRFLKAMKVAWEEHHLCMTMMSDVLMYMDRVYAKQANVPPFYEAGTALFRDYVVRSPQFPISRTTANTLLQQIRAERDGDIIDRTTMKACISMLEALPDTRRIGDTVYQSDVEDRLLLATQDYYFVEGDQMIASCTASEYLVHANKRLQEEYERSQSCLSQSSEPKLRAIVEEQLVARHLRTLLESETGLRHMMNNEKLEDLVLLYKLCFRIDYDLVDLKFQLSQIVLENGRVINNTVGLIDGNSEDIASKSVSGERMNPSAIAMKWVEDVVALKSRYDRILTKAMANDNSIQATFTNSLCLFINDNEKASEYISLFIDEHMKKGLKGKTEDEAESILEKTIILFRYIANKDVFERLLMGRSISDDAERAMITKMKIEVGYTFTSKLEGMFKDMKLSEDIMDEFKDHIRVTKCAQIFEISANVLTSTFWPQNMISGDIGSHGCIFPQEVEKTRQIFQRFYLSRHNGRQLSWLPNMGTADVRAHFKRRWHDLVVTSYAMAILLLFNDMEQGSSLSYGDIQSATQIPESDLIRNLQSLAVAPKHRILVKEPMSRDVKPSDQFFFNENFTSQYTRIKINIVAGSKIESEVERKETMEKVEAMRNIQVEAAIVRIMKDRKVLDHNNIVSEVTKQMSNRFLPNPPQIKKRIEGLIEREYLERVDGNNFKYLKHYQYQKATFPYPIGGISYLIEAIDRVVMSSKLRKVRQVSDGKLWWSSVIRGASSQAALREEPNDEDSEDGLMSRLQPKPKPVYRVDKRNDQPISDKLSKSWKLKTTRNTVDKRHRKGKVTQRREEATDLFENDVNGHLYDMNFLQKDYARYLDGEHVRSALLGPKSFLKEKLKLSIEDSTRTRKSRDRQDTCITRLHIRLVEKQLDDISTQGSGTTVRESERAGYTHAILVLEEKGYLKQLMPGGPLAAVTSRDLSANPNARAEVLIYCVRYDSFPSLSLTRIKVRGKWTWQSKIHLESQGIDAIANDRTPDRAEHMASIVFKRLADQYHAAHGKDTIFVKDLSQLSLSNARAFCIECSRIQRLPRLSHLAETKGATTYGDIREEGTDNVLASVTVSNGCKPKFVEDAAYLKYALALKLDHPAVWSKFSEQLKQNNGEFVKTMSPLRLDFHHSSLTKMRALLRKDLEQEFDSEGVAVAMTQEVFRQPSNRVKVVHDASKVEERSQALLQKYDEYNLDEKMASTREQRASFPLNQYRDRVLKLIDENIVCIVLGATGSGKTTQVPQLVLEEAIKVSKGGECNVICTQPRRIAAISVAQRVASERGEHLQESVGYRVRFDARPPHHTGSILYCTTGVLLKQLQDQGADALDKVSHIVIDEVHERDTLIDFLMLLVKRAMIERKQRGKPPIKLILMSATIDTSLFSRYFGDGSLSTKCPTLEVPGRTFPVKTVYMDDFVPMFDKLYTRRATPLLNERATQNFISDERAFKVVEQTNIPKPARIEKDDSGKGMVNWSDAGLVDEEGLSMDLASIDPEDAKTPIALMALTVAHILKTTSEGSILVFLPGYGEINEMKKIIDTQRILDVDFKDARKYKFYTLHSLMPNVQQSVFEKLENGTRKIILATNIAETSITIPDVKHVIDSGKCREKHYDQSTRMTRLLCTWISKSNCKQRSGRAGRVSDGVYWGMMSRNRFESMPAGITAEILRSDLQETCLEIKNLGVRESAASFLADCVEPPSTFAITAAVKQLQALKALNPEENLTWLGKTLAALPVEPALGKMILLSIVFRCLDPILILAARSTAKDPMFMPMDPLQKGVADQKRKTLAAGSKSDHVAFLRAFHLTRELLKQHSQNDVVHMLNREFVNFGSMRTIMQTAREIHDILVTRRLLPSKAANTGVRESTRQQDGNVWSIFGDEEYNTHSGNIGLVKAILLYGHYPNVASYYSSRLLRTDRDNVALVHPSSVNCPQGPTGSKYGRVAQDQLVPYGSLYLFGQKVRANPKQVFLRSTTEVSPITALFFNGSLTSSRNVLEVDSWLRMYTDDGSATRTVQDFKRLIENFVDHGLAQLSSRNPWKPDLEPVIVREVANILLSES